MARVLAVALGRWPYDPTALWWPTSRSPLGQVIRPGLTTRHFICYVNIPLDLKQDTLRSFFPFPLLQSQRVKRRRWWFPAAIPPAPFFSGGQRGVGEGGGLGNRRAIVYRVGKSRSRVCSSLVDGGARVDRRVGASPCGVLFLATSVRRRCR
jgi:hypothetical protein